MHLQNICVSFEYQGPEVKFKITGVVEHWKSELLMILYQHTEMGVKCRAGGGVVQRDQRQGSLLLPCTTVHQSWSSWWCNLFLHSGRLLWQCHSCLQSAPSLLYVLAALNAWDAEYCDDPVTWTSVTLSVFSSRCHDMVIILLLLIVSQLLVL